MYLADQARATPDKPAAIDAATGEILTYRQLDENSTRFARYLQAAGLQRGDRVALFMENRLSFFEIAWAALRSGLYLTAVNRYLTAEEAGYIVDDCDAKVLVASAALGEVARALPARAPRCGRLVSVGGPIEGWERYEEVLARHEATPLAAEWAGDTMLYSSGTTGRPKGVQRPLPEGSPREGFRGAETMRAYGFNEDTIYLSPAPLYHAAPLAYAIGTQWDGGTVVMMPHFDAETTLALIERYRVTHGQFVPTMFVRMLKLPPEARSRYDLSSLRVAIHAAAPCPPDVKREMIGWWGPVIYEYYGGTEANGVTRVTTEEWLAHPGTVGLAKLGILHICDEDGTELPPGAPGLIYFEREEMPFAYHKDPGKTAAAQHSLHPNWSTLGDIGYVDEEGYLYLTDRRAFMIISGGVNIYPREIEDVLIGHPAVRDVAVFGVPNPDFGEEVKAVVELMDGVEPSEETRAALLAYAGEHLARFKVPRSIDFTDALPRLPTGKLYKKALQAAYWPARAPDAARR